MTKENVSDLASLLSAPITEPLSPVVVEYYLARSPFIPLPGVSNLRQLSSPNLLPNRIFRSALLTYAPEASLSLLHTRYNIQTVYDLRSIIERDEAPSPIIQGVETVWIHNTMDGAVFVKDENGQQKRKPAPEPVPIANFLEGDGVEALIAKYRNILDMHGHIYKKVFEALSDGDRPVLFHCSAGKDRTGVLAALILAFCHTPREMIAQDFILTRIGIEPFREHPNCQRFFAAKMTIGTDGQRTKVLSEPGLVAMCQIREAPILGFLDWMDDKWGDVVDKGKRREDAYPGVHGWLIKEMGFEEEHLNKIKRNLGVLMT